MFCTRTCIRIFIVYVQEIENLVKLNHKSLFQIENGFDFYTIRVFVGEGDKFKINLKQCL